MEKLLKSVNFFGYSIIVLILLPNFVTAALPPKLQGCPLKLSTEEFDSCAVEFLHEFRNNMRQGIPSLNLPRYDPLYVERIDFKRYTKYFKLDGILRNLHIDGASDYVVESAHLDKGSLTFGVTATFKYVDIKSEFEFLGTVLGVKVPTRGTVTGKFSNTKFKMIGQFGTFLDPSGDERMKLTSVKSFVQLGDGPLDLKTPPDLQWAANMIVYFYGKTRASMLKILTPMINDIDDQVILKLVEPILHSIKRNELLIPS